MSKALIIKQLKRTQQNKPDEVLNFKTGLNLIVGPGNTGKTKWLSMLDYLMGDPDKPEDTFGNDLAQKYDSIEAIFQIGEKEILVERHWKKRGMKGKVFINGEPIPAESFSEFLLSELDIPILHYPQGSPYSERKWSTLSWRTMLRHIYRRQRFWGDLVPKQPDSEQHACLMQFLGMAENIFSDEYGELIAKRKRVFKLQGIKEEFLKLLDEVSKDLVEEKEVRVTLTKQSIDLAITRLNSEIESFQSQRENSLTELLQVSVNHTNDGQNAFNQLSQSWGELQLAKENNLSHLAQIKKRIEDLKDYKIALTNELAKIQRVQSAGKILADIKVTHCPACDQSVSQSQSDEKHCFLCHQSINVNTGNGDTKRINFEANQITEELDEIDDLLDTLSQDNKTTREERKIIEEEIKRIDNQMRPVRQIAASIIPPEIAVIDMNVGRLQERVRQLERLKVMVDRQNNLSTEIDQIQKEIVDLEIQVKQLSKNINLEQSSDLLTNGMNSYLNALQAQGKNLWTQGSISFKLRNRDFRISIDEEKWSTKLGGTLALYFLISYHYALLNLTPRTGTHYPGLVILDLPPTLEDGSTVKDKENFVLEPFIDLLKQPGMEACQIITTGAAFEGLNEANKIKFTKVWE